MDLRHEPVVLDTQRYRISGTLTLPREGYRSRLSDFLNQRDRDFFAIADATITPFDGSESPTVEPFVLVARAHIVVVRPAGGTDEE